jgi:hypothetical protein
MPYAASSPFCRSIQVTFVFPASGRRPLTLKKKSRMVAMIPFLQTEKRRHFVPREAGFGWPAWRADAELLESATHIVSNTGCLRPPPIWA